MIAQEQITWEDFSRIMKEVYGQQVTNHDIKTEIEAHTRCVVLLYFKTVENPVSMDFFAFLGCAGKPTQLESLDSELFRLR